MWTYSSPDHTNKWKALYPQEQYDELPAELAASKPETEDKDAGLKAEDFVVDVFFCF